MATHSSILAWKIPWTEEPGRLQSMRLQRVGHNWALFGLPSGSVVKKKNLPNTQEMREMWVRSPDRSPGEGDGNPLQYSFQEESCGQRIWTKSMELRRVRHVWSDWAHKYLFNVFKSHVNFHFCELFVHILGQFFYRILAFCILIYELSLCYRNLSVTYVA